jgi:hypothetical protein
MIPIPTTSEHLQVRCPRKIGQEGLSGSLVLDAATAMIMQLAHCAMAKHVWHGQFLDTHGFTLQRWINLKENLQQVQLVDMGKRRRNRVDRCLDLITIPSFMSFHQLI